MRCDIETVFLSSLITFIFGMLSLIAYSLQTPDNKAGQQLVWQALLFGTWLAAILFLQGLLGDYQIFHS